MARDFVDFQGGEPIQAFHFNQIYAELRRWRKMSVIPPLVLRDAGNSDSPPKLDLQVQNMVIGVANGAIAAASGNGYATGNVDILRINFANGTLDAGATIKVYNAARDGNSGVGSIAGGTRVCVQWDADKVPWVAPLECP